MGAADALTGGLRRALRGARAALPGQGRALVDSASAGSGPAGSGPADSASAGSGLVDSGTADSGPAGVVLVDEPADVLRSAAVAHAGAAARWADPAEHGPSTPPSRPVPPAPAAPAAGPTQPPPPQVTPTQLPPAQPPAAAQATAPTHQIAPVWTAEELASFRSALDADIARLRSELDSGEADLADLIADSRDGAGDDQADVGSKTFERENEMIVNLNTRELLDQALRARTRLDDGTYGRCESCGRPIAAGRLRAFPRATLCIACKQAEERR